MAPEPNAQPTGPPPMSDAEMAAMQQAMTGPMQVTLEEAHAEACRTIGEQQVTIRLLSQRVMVLTQMLQAQQPQAQQAPPGQPVNRQQRRATARKNGKPAGKADLAPVSG